jgi:NAD(P)-dependent dehydrogenase (short-subunit alcohol dehydrogenase family)
MRLFSWLFIGIFLSACSPDGLTRDATAQPPTVLVTGSNRGIGLEFVRQYAAKGWFVIATTRRPQEADRLLQLAHDHTNIRVELLDVTNSEHLTALADKYQNRPIDVLINNAGISGDFLGPGQRFGSLDYDVMTTFMGVNAIGPLRVTEAFYENVKSSRQKKVIAITALLGVHSFKYGDFDGAYWYKISKAAMNAAMYNVAREAAKDGITVTLLTPGEVAVEKVKNPAPRFISPEESIRGMIGVIENLTAEDSGTILRYNGQRFEF